MSPDKWDEQVTLEEQPVPMKKPTHHLITEIPRWHTRTELTMVSILRMSGAITAVSTRRAKSSIEVALNELPDKAQQVCGFRAQFDRDR